MHAVLADVLDHVDDGGGHQHGACHVGPPVERRGVVEAGDFLRNARVDPVRRERKERIGVFPGDSGDTGRGRRVDRKDLPEQCGRLDLEALAELLVQCLEQLEELGHRRMNVTAGPFAERTHDVFRVPLSALPAALRRFQLSAHSADTAAVHELQ